MIETPRDGPAGAGEAVTTPAPVRPSSRVETVSNPGAMTPATVSAEPDAFSRGVRRVRDVMSHNVPALPREATVYAAVELFRTHRLDALPVLDGEAVVGLLEPLALALYDGSVSIAEILTGTPLTVAPDETVPEAARRMRSGGQRNAPVIQDGRLVGLLGERDLLDAWGAIHDPLTDLPVQHQFRHWVSLQLSAGREVAILFLDLNDFGAVNKRRGHVIGDQALCAVAEVIRDTIDPDQDFACRYGGDEFAIGTTRHVTGARFLATQVRDRVAALDLNNEPLELSVAIGLSGGQRVRIRPDAHVEATLDDLITRASTASTAAKQMPEHICSFNTGSAAVPSGEPSTPGVPPSARPRVVVDSYRIGQTGPEVEVTVGLRAGQEREERNCIVPEGELARALATATARCLQSFASEPIEIDVEETYEYETPQGLSCVGATIAVARAAGSTERLVGASPLRGDLHRSYINAVLDAVNRRVL